MDWTRSEKRRGYLGAIRAFNATLATPATPPPVRLSIHRIPIALTHIDNTDNNNTAATTTARQGIAAQESINDPFSTRHSAPLRRTKCCRGRVSNSHYARTSLLRGPRLPSAWPAVYTAPRARRNQSTNLVITLFSRGFLLCHTKHRLAAIGPL